MFDRIFQLPGIPMSIASGVIFALIACACIVAARRFAQSHMHAEGSSKGFTEAVMALFAAIYGILLGLLAVSAYDNVKKVNDIVSTEASIISVVYLDANGFPPPTRDRLQAGLQAYVREVVNNSIPQQRQGIRPTGERPMAAEVLRAVQSFEPKTRTEEALQAEVFRQLSNLQQVRHERLDSSHVRIPPVLWWIVGLGAAVAVLMISLLDSPLRPHLILGGLLAFYIGAMIFVIASMDNSFSGPDDVGSEAFEQLLRLVETPP
jgi:hypothetical protein